jgi:hypothetical protein
MRDFLLFEMVFGKYIMQIREMKLLYSKTRHTGAGQKKIQMSG